MQRKILANIFIELVYSNVHFAKLSGRTYDSRLEGGDGMKGMGQARIGPLSVQTQLRVCLQLLVEQNRLSGR
jgi:hypothetical protein